MRFGKYSFRPAFWPTLATLLLVPLMVGLGIWQAQRAEWKQGLVDANVERSALPDASLQALLPVTVADQYRPVAMTGRYDLEHQLLLDNRTWQGRPGYEVLTPFFPSAGGPAVLVNRGWVPAHPDRSILPELPGTAEEVRIHATIKLPAEDNFRLADVEEAQTGWPRVVQQPEMEQLERLAGYPLLPVLLLLDNDAEHGFLRDWKPVYGVTPDKHRAYAMQWFTLALVLVLIYVSVNTKRTGNKSVDNQ